MAILESDERNIIEADEFNWRLVVYPILVVVAALLIGFGIYYYQLNQREQAEEAAATAISTAKTPADLNKIADTYPDTTQAAVAQMKSGALSLAAKDYPAAQKSYQAVLDSKQAPVELHDAAQLGLAAAQEASGKADDAIQTYLAVAQKGNESAFAPVAYHQVAAIYASREDKTNEEKTLQQAVRLGGDSSFVKQAAEQLKALTPETPVATPAAP
jgi:predicted negative regulator of RcsB-dependent stress response